ncbi:MAG: MarR family transcriptional regulator [Pirellulales bacterium]
MKAATPRKAAKTRPAAPPSDVKMTRLQGQYLAFIFWYSKINRKAPSEGDMEKYFNVTPPAVHTMVLKLEKIGVISRVPHEFRSIKVLAKRKDIPELE